MTDLYATARLHPHTVTNAHLHLKKRLGSLKISSRCVTIKVDPRVWAVARKLSEGNPRRIEVVSATEVIVHNNPR